MDGFVSCGRVMVIHPAAAAQMIQSTAAAASNSVYFLRFQLLYLQVFAIDSLLSFVILWKHYELMFEHYVMHTLQYVKYYERIHDSV